MIFFEVHDPKKPFEKLDKHLTEGEISLKQLVEDIGDIVSHMRSIDINDSRYADQLAEIERKYRACLNRIQTLIWPIVGISGGLLLQDIVDPDTFVINPNIDWKEWATKALQYGGVPLAIYELLKILARVKRFIKQRSME